MALIILSHPCAGKTYLAKRTKGFSDNPPHPAKKAKFVAVSRLHPERAYDVAMILNDKDFDRNTKSRVEKNPVGKLFTKEEHIRKEREETRKLAERLEIPIYDSFEKIMKEYE